MNHNYQLGFSYYIGENGLLSRKEMLLSIGIMSFLV